MSYISGNEIFQLQSRKIAYISGNETFGSNDKKFLYFLIFWEMENPKKFLIFQEMETLKIVREIKFSAQAPKNDKNLL